MNKKERLKFLKEASLDKQAEDISEDVNLADIEDPQEYASKVFDILLENLKGNISIDGLDD